MLLESDHDIPTMAVENPVANNNAAAAGAAANKEIQHREDDTSGDQPPPLIMDYDSSDNDDVDDDDVSSAGVNVLPVYPPRKLPVNEKIHAPDSNKNSTDVV